MSDDVPSAEAATPAPPRARSRSLRALRWLALGLAALMLLFVLAGTGLWRYGQSDDSLSWALRLAGRWLPLQVEGVQGSLRAGGHIEKLTYRTPDGLLVEMQGVVGAWQFTPWPQHLHVKNVQIDSLRLDDTRPPRPWSPAPPQITLPFGVTVDQARLGAYYSGAATKPLLRDVQLRAQSDGTVHQLLDLQARWAQDAINGTVTTPKFTFDGAHGGALQGHFNGEFDASESSGVAPLQWQADVKGPWERFDLQAQVHRAMDASKPQTPDPGRAALRAEVTPWGKLPVHQADLKLDALDLAPLSAQWPQTRLSGTLQVLPPPPAASDTADKTPKAAAAPWRVQGHITNALPGPWDKKRLPLDRVDLNADWQANRLTLHDLKAQLAGGQLTAQGQWQPASNPPPESKAAASGATKTTPSPASPWAMNLHLTNIDPQRLHSQAAAQPISGDVRVRSDVAAGAALQFEADLTGASGKVVRSDAFALDRLRTQGSWSATQRTLLLPLLNLQASNAQVQGRANLHFPTPPAGAAPNARAPMPEGQAELNVNAPGLKAILEGRLQGNTGQGRWQVNATQADAFWRWLRSVPLVGATLPAGSLSGQAQWQGAWQGGWPDPAVQSTLKAPALSWQPAPVKGAAAKAAPPQAIALRDLQGRFDGRLSKAQWQLSGQGQTTPLASATRPATPPTAVQWQSSGDLSRPPATRGVQDTVVGLRQADISVRQGNQRSWRAVSQLPFSVRVRQGTPTDANALVEVAASPANWQISGTGFDSPGALRWQASTWQRGTLNTQGDVSQFPIQVLLALQSQPNPDLPLHGDLRLQGRWNLQMSASTLALNAQLQRQSGDIGFSRKDPDTGVVARYDAGLTQALVNVVGDGDRVRATAQWVGNLLGSGSAQIDTRLQAAPQSALGRDWTASAPLSGTLTAQVPRLAVATAVLPAGWRLKGNAKIDARIGGTRGDPRIDGTLQGDDVGLRSVVDGFELKDGRLRAQFTGDQLQVNELRLYGAGKDADRGQVLITGTVRWPQGQTIAQLQARFDKLQPSLQTDRLLALSGVLDGTLQDQLARVTGQLKVDRARIVIADDQAPKLGSDVVVRRGGRVVFPREAAPTTAERAQVANAKAQAQPKPTALRSDVNVQVDLGPDFQLKALGMVDTRLAGQLQITGQGAPVPEPRVVGVVTTEGGTVRAYSQLLNITRGTVRFSGNASNPSLDILALRPIYDADQKVGVQVVGTALSPRVDLYASPDLSDSQKLAWLMLGRAAPSNGAELALIQSAALAALGGRDGRSLASRVGLDELSLSQATDGSGNVNDMTVRLGRRLGQRLYASYERTLSGAVGTLYIFYTLSRQFTLRAQAGDQLGVDLIYSTSYD